MKKNTKQKLILGIILAIAVILCGLYINKILRFFRELNQQNLKYHKGSFTITSFKVV